jgi:hypothetical protein
VLLGHPEVRLNPHVGSAGLPREPAGLAEQQDESANQRKRDAGDQKRDSELVGTGGRGGRRLGRL